MDATVTDAARDLFNATVQHTMTGDTDALAGAIVGHVERILATECETTEDAHTLLMVSNSLVSANHWARRSLLQSDQTQPDEDWERFLIWLTECALLFNERAFVVIAGSNPNTTFDAMAFVRDELKVGYLN